jgi:hypothetical protein
MHARSYAPSELLPSLLNSFKQKERYECRKMYRLIVVLHKAKSPIPEPMRCN